MSAPARTETGFHQPRELDVGAAARGRVDIEPGESQPPRDGTLMNVDVLDPAGRNRRELAQEHAVRDDEVVLAHRPTPVGVGARHHQARTTAPSAKYDAPMAMLNGIALSSQKRRGESGRTMVNDG